MVFLSRDFGLNHERLVSLVRTELGDALLFGCSASGVIGAGREIEEQPAVSITAAVLPEVSLHPAHVESAQLPPVYAERAAWEGALGVRERDDPSFIVIADPFTFESESLLRGLDRAFPRAPKIGGLASGGREPGGNVLWLGNKVHHSGAIVLALTGNVTVDTIVAQGCRPIGDPMFVTSCHGNLLRELDRRVPRDVLGELYERLPARDRELVENSLSLGLAMPGERPEVRPGDFLIRNVIGMDAQSGALWVGAELEPNAIVQFHVRDALSSGEDLERSLVAAAARGRRAPAAVMLFSCIGRGERLYGHADHDSNALRRHLGELPIGGFFCSGEMGPVQGMTQLHGYTSAIAMFRPRRQ
jgi:small ligand-binding sensory domain FIST